MNKRQQTIIGITNDLYKRLALFDNDSFVHCITANISLSKHLNSIYRSLLKQYDSRIFFGDEIESLELADYEHNTFHVMRIIALVTEELKRNNDNVNMLQGIIESITSKSSLPNWLKRKLITYIPLLLIKNYSKDFMNQSSSPKNDEYVVFLKDKIEYMDRAKLKRFREKHRPDKFDIFIENTDVVSIHIMNNSSIFRAGNYHPFNILSLFLQRLGSSLTYQEIYHLAIKPSEKTLPRDHSKKVYDYLKIIRKKINECETINVEPEEWFKRDHKKGIISISESINGCLITTDQRIAI